MIGRRKPKADPVTREPIARVPWDPLDVSDDPEVPAHTCPFCGKRIRPESKACTRHNHRLARSARERACRTCGKRFTPYPSAIKRTESAYCSRACWYAEAGKRPAMVDATCTQCGSTFRRTQAALRRVKHPMCSRECAQKYRLGPDSPVYRGGHLSSYRGPRWRQIAAEIRDRDGHRCRRCGKSEADNGRTLPVDHVIPWRTFATATEANRPENLVAVCDSCHSRKLHAETRWLKGDVLDMRSYQIAVAKPWDQRDTAA